jgi:hypothetical protein
MSRNPRKKPLQHSHGWLVEDIFSPSETTGPVTPSPTIRFSRNVHAADRPEPVPGVKAPLPLHIFMAGSGSLSMALHVKRGESDLRVWDGDCEVFGTSSQEKMRGFIIQGLPRPLLLTVIEAEWDLGKTTLRCVNPDSTVEVVLQPADPTWAIKWPKAWNKCEPKRLLHVISPYLTHAAAAWGAKHLALAGWSDLGSYFYRPDGDVRALGVEWKIISPVGLSRVSNLRVEKEGGSLDGVFWKGAGWILRLPFTEQRIADCPLEKSTWSARDGVSFLPGPSGNLPLPEGALKDARAYVTGKGTSVKLEIIVDGAVRLEAVRSMAQSLPIPFSRWVSYRMLYSLWGHSPMHLLVMPDSLIFYEGDEAVVLRAPPV